MQTICARVRDGLQYPIKPKIGKFQPNFAWEGACRTVLIFLRVHAGNEMAEYVDAETQTLLACFVVADFGQAAPQRRIILCNLPSFLQQQAFSIIIILSLFLHVFQS